MSNLNPVASWSLNSVPELEVNTAALGGPGGPMNLQAQALLNNLAALNSPVGASYIGFSQAGSSIIRTAMQKMQEWVSILDYGADPTGTTDSTVAIQNALNSGARLVYVPPGTYLVSSYLLVPSGVTIYGAGGKASQLLVTGVFSTFTAWGTAHQGQLILLNGDDACVVNIFVNGQGFNAGGVAAWAFHGNRIVSNIVMNTGTVQAVLATASMRLQEYQNFFQYVGHGSELWQIVDSNIVGNIARVVAGGGLWTADATNTNIASNIVAHCGDVGLDIEGGTNTQVVGNLGYACNNGELTYFNNGTSSGKVPTNCTFKANTAFRTSTYLAGPSETPTATSTTNGALTIYSVNPLQYNIDFSDNTIYATGRTALFVYDLGPNPCGVKLSNNTFVSDTLLHWVQRAYNIQVVHNTFYGIGATVAAAQNEFKNCSNGLWDDNTYDYDTPKNTNAALYYYTDLAIPQSPTISRNKFRNCGAFAFKHDPYNSGVPAIVYDNAFSETWQPNGGVESTANGYPLYRHQKMLYSFTNSGSLNATLDMSTLTSLGGGAVTARGLLQVWMGGSRGSTYELVYPSGGAVFSRDGTGTTSGIGNVGNGRYLSSITGSVLTIAGPANGPIGYLDMELTTFA